MSGLKLSFSSCYDVGRGRRGREKQTLPVGVVQSKSSKIEMIRNTFIRCEVSKIKCYLLLNLLKYLNDILGADNQIGSCCPNPINKFLEITYFEYC